MKLLTKLQEYLNIIVLIVLSLVPLLWFWKKDGLIINGVDTNFPLDPLVWIGRRFYVWNDISNGGSDFSSSTAGIFFHLIQTIPYILGLNLQTSQIISLIFWFSVIVFSAFLLARVFFPKKFFIQLIFVVFYTFNIYLFNTWENVKVANLSLVAAIPFALYTMISLWNGKITYLRAIFYSAISGIILSGGGINPAYFLTFFLILFIFFLPNILLHQEKGTILKRFRDLLLISCIIFFVNLFWILPTANFIIRDIPSGNSLNEIGFSNWLDSLSKNTSIVNVLRVQGAWDWYAFDSKSGLPLYIPYALNYFYRIPFLVFSFILPFIAIMSLLIYEKSKRHLYVAFSLMFLAGIFFGAGSHPPTGALFSFLVNNIPFFSLFRSPWYIFTPLMLISYAGLISLFFYSIKFKLSDSRAVRLILPLLMTTLVIANLVYTYPLVSGKIFRPDRRDGFYVKFPEYIFDSKDWLAENSEGRIITYPEDEIENFKWGYRGVDSIINLFSNNEMIYPSLNATSSNISILTRELYQSLKKEQMDSVYKIASKLNGKMIFEKQDQASLSQALPAEIKGLKNKNFGEWFFYQLPGNEFLPKIFFANNVFSVYPYAGAEKAIGVVGAKDIIVNHDDKIIKQIKYGSVIDQNVILSDNSQITDYYNFRNSLPTLSRRLLSRDLSKATFSFEVLSNSHYQPILERFRLESFGIDPNKDLEVEVDGTQLIFKVDHLSDSYVYYQPLAFFSGKHSITLKLVNKNLVKGDFSSEATFTKGGEGKGEGWYQIGEEGQEKFLSILNIDKADINADFNVSEFDPLSTYYIEVKYRQIYGNNAQILVTQLRDNILFKAQAESMPNYPEWQTFSLYYEPVNTQSLLNVGLVAPFISDPLGTKVFYKKLRVYPVFTNKLLLISQDKEEQGLLLSKPDIEFKKISPVFYEAEISKADGPQILVFSENYSPEWKLSLFGADGVELPLKPLHFSANLYANAWYINDTPQSYRLKIYYQPQTLFTIGAFFSGLVLLIPLMIFFVKIMRNRLKKHEKDI